MTVQTASSKGQVTIPVAIRRKLGIEAGTPVQFVERDGWVILEKVDARLQTLCGLLTASEPIALDDIDEVIGASVKSKLSRRAGG